MKTIVIYDSMYGNTEKIAKTIAESVESAKLYKVDAVKLEDIKKAQLLVVGSPTHGGWYTEPFKKLFLEICEDDLAHIKVAAFSTATSKKDEGWFVRMIIDIFGYATDRIAKELATKGAQIISKETFFVKGKEGPLSDGEIKKAQNWGNFLTKK